MLCLFVSTHVAHLVCRIFTGGIEYMIPIDGRNMENSLIAARGFVGIEELIDLLIMSRTKFEVPIIFIFDCCRIDLGPGGGRTVVNLHGTPGVNVLNNRGGVANIFIMYSTASGHIASNGGSGSNNGAYAEYFLKYLDQTTSISELSTAVRRGLFNDSRYRNMQVYF